MGVAVGQAFPLLAALVVCAMPCDAYGDLLNQWVARTARVDSLYVEGKVRQYRVAANKDPMDSKNWEQREGIGPLVVEFSVLLRRPDLRFNLRVPAQGTTKYQSADHAWLDGKHYEVGSLDIPGAGAGSISDRFHNGSLAAVPYLTPLEFDFFDYPATDVSREFAKLARTIDGNRILLQINSSADKPDGGNLWLAEIEVDPEHDLVPRRMRLTIETGSDKRIYWTLETRSTAELDGTTLIQQATLILWNQLVLPNERVVYLWEATKIEKRPITLADIELSFPAGMFVMDYTTNRSWTATESGEPRDVQHLSSETIQKLAEAAQAGMLTPEIRSRRRTAMSWILGGAAVLVFAVALAAYHARRKSGATGYG